ncbi:hypothetical protein PoB_002557000 [Plakobranchus ocellatus]|uniref:Uncharacterized protein n=1 Tax=Plakobranchus ocellatus TaxID=259542 RepID=A0AAV3ZTB6_9GAST|nr:hypothetical protein PoB_002557000 [Plakobranchus ocellatus]
MRFPPACSTDCLSQSAGLLRVNWSQSKDPNGRKLQLQIGYIQFLLGEKKKGSHTILARSHHTSHICRQPVNRPRATPNRATSNTGHTTSILLQVSHFKSPKSRPINSQELQDASTIIWD